MRLGWGLTLGTSSASIAALPDQHEYLALGRNLLDGQGLRFFDARFGDWVYAYRTPGYPLFVAMNGGNVRVIRVVQPVIDVSTVLAVYLLARTLVRRPGTRKDAADPAGEMISPSPGNPGEGGGEGAAPSSPAGHPHPNPLPEYWERGQEFRRNAGPLLAAAFVAFNPFLIYFSGLILSETLFTAIVIWGMFLLSVARVSNPCFESKTWVENPCRINSCRRWALCWLGGGLLLAFSVLIRPSAFFLPPLLGIAACFSNRPGSAAYQTRRPLRAAAVMFLLVVVVLFPWAWRNSRPWVLGEWIWTTTNGGITAYDGFNPAASGASDQSFLRSLPQLAKMNEVGRSRYLENEAWLYVRENPLRAIELGFIKIARTWSPLPLSEQFGRTGYRLVALCYALPFDLLILAGLIKGRLPGATKVFLLATAIYFTAVHAASIGSLRYRLPAEPPMSILIAAIPWRRQTVNRPRGS